MIRFDDMPVRYPVGEQSFKALRQGGYLYVDKTEFVARLIWQGKFIFLARPRRFGKSLLLSTIEYYFRGEKELFDSTWIGERETDWKSYPVLHFDMSRCNGQSAEILNAHLHRKVEDYEKEYGLEIHSEIQDIGDRFNTLITSIHKKVGAEVVILIDEYDKGILETLDETQAKRDAMSTVLRAFYSQPKAATESVKFCMVTGVARFGSYTLFSGPNNYLDISMNATYASICGITQEELLSNFEEGIAKMSEKLQETKQETIEALRQKYDSYRFTESDALVYNPYSLLSAFSEGKMDNFWIKSGISKVFVKYLTRSEFDLMELEKLWVTRERMEGTYSKEDSIPLLFQTGYLTIKDVRNLKLYRLGIPNGEIRSALVEQLMPRFMGISADTFSELLTDLQDNIKLGQIEGWIMDIKSLISKIPNQLFGPIESHLPDEYERAKVKETNIANFERTYHLIIHMIGQMINIEARSEVSFAGGRADMVIETNNYVYVVEFKLDSTASVALKQIDEKGYLLPWHADRRQVYKIGISFSSKDRNIVDYAYQGSEEN
ncbi:MAG: ATP-binding protein [Bacteroidales bacterium]|nr:ATP-binding protein [Bacteroidales bacterium]